LVLASVILRVRCVPPSCPYNLNIRGTCPASSTGRRRGVTWIVDRLSTVYLFTMSTIFIGIILPCRPFLCIHLYSPFLAASKQITRTTERDIRQMFTMKAIFNVIIYNVGYFSLLHCGLKKHAKMFLSYLLQNEADSDNIWYTLS